MLKQVVEKATAKKEEVQEARRRAEDVEKALREALKEYESSRGGLEQRHPYNAAEAADNLKALHELEEEVRAASEREHMALAAQEEAEDRVVRLQQQASQAQQCVASLQASHAELLTRAERETEARMTAEAAAVAALEQLQHVRESACGSSAYGNARSSVPWRSMPPHAVGKDIRLDAMDEDSIAQQGHTRPRTAPSASNQTHDLAMGVMEFARAMGHTVVSPVVSGVKTLGRLAGGAESHVHADGSTIELASNPALKEGVDAEGCEHGQGMGLQSSQHVTGASGPEVFETPSGAGDMEDESILLGSSVRSSASFDQVSRPAAADEVAADERPPVQQAGGDESSLVCLQSTVLPLPVDSRVCEEVGDVDGQESRSYSEAHGTMDANGGKEDATALVTNVQTPQTSMADTVAHSSRPSTAPLRPSAAADDSRPVTPPVAGGGWQGGRDGGGEVLATAELGHVTPLDPAAIIMPDARDRARAAGSAEGIDGIGSPSAGWQVAASSLKPARLADPNHPLRPGVGLPSLDETDASATQSVYCSTLDDTQATGTTFGMAAAAALPAAAAGDRLRSSLNMALDLFNVARASGQRGAAADIVASLRASQHRIAEALAAYDQELAEPSACRAPSCLPNEEKQRDGARTTSSAMERGVGGEASTLGKDRDVDNVPHALPFQVLPWSSQPSGATPAAVSVTPDTQSPMVTTRQLVVPTLSLPSKPDGAVASAASAIAGDGRDADLCMPPREGCSVGVWGGGAAGACSHVSLSTALPSARSSMEYGGSNPNSHRCNFENLSEISIASEGRTVVDVEEVLERYSERLLQMVSAKLRKGASAVPAGAEVGQGERGAQPC